MRVVVKDEEVRLGGNVVLINVQILIQLVWVRLKNLDF